MASTIIFGILMFGVLIFIHELGHFIAARKCGVGVYEFSIGMGPKLISHTSKKSGILYSLRLLPIGGFVAMHGEDDDDNFDNDKTSLSKKPIWKRFIVISAGALMNLILGFIICFFLVIFGGDIASTKIEEFRFSEMEGRGLEIGDEIIDVDGKNINIWHDFSYELMNLPGEKVDITVIRDGKEVVVHDFKIPYYIDNKTGIKLGAASFIKPEKAEKDFSEVIKQTFFQPIAVVRVTWVSLIDTLKGRYGTEALSGPVGVVSELDEVKKVGGNSSLFFMMMLITINLGIMNLLPIPALDGGRLLFLLIEAIIRKPIPKKVEAAVNSIGLMLLMGLMLFVTCKDILKLF